MVHIGSQMFSNKTCFADAFPLEDVHELFLRIMHCPSRTCVTTLALSTPTAPIPIIPEVRVYTDRMHNPCLFFLSLCPCSEIQKSESLIITQCRNSGGNG